MQHSVLSCINFYPGLLKKFCLKVSQFSSIVGSHLQSTKYRRILFKYFKKIYKDLHGQKPTHLLSVPGYSSGSASRIPLFPWILQCSSHNLSTEKQRSIKSENFLTCVCLKFIKVLVAKKRQKGEKPSIAIKLHELYFEKYIEGRVIYDGKKRIALRVRFYFPKC